MASIRPKIELDFKKSLAQVKELQKELAKIDKLLKKSTDGNGGGFSSFAGGDKSAVPNIKRLATAQNELKQATFGLAKSLANEREKLRQVNNENRLSAKENTRTTNTVARLQAETNKLVNTFKNIKIGTEEWKRLQKQIVVNSKALNDYDRSILRHNRNVGNYAGSVRGLITSITGLSFSFYGLNIALRRTVGLLADISKAQGSVEKTTGMSRDRVRDLTDSFKSFDTETSMKGLLDIAASAGKMGIAAEDIKEFTKVADQVIVAFADDLDGNTKQIVTDLAKMTRIFPDLKDLTPAEAMQRLSSSMNYLANNTTAAVEPIKDITKRLLGTASTAGIASDKIVGLAGGLDRLGLGSEVAATAVMKILTELSKGENFDKFASVAKNAGIETQEFARLMKEDAFEAFMSVIKGAESSSTGLDKFREIVETFGINTQRAKAIVVGLTSNFDILEETVKMSSKAFKEGTSITEEFNIMNTTLDANLKKISKAFSNILLNKKLVEFIEDLTSNANALVTTTYTLAGAIGSSLIPSIIAYGKTVKWAALLTKFSLGWMNLLAAGIGALVVWFGSKFVFATEKATTAIGKMNDKFKLTEKYISRIRKQLDEMSKAQLESQILVDDKKLKEQKEKLDKYRKALKLIEDAGMGNSDKKARLGIPGLSDMNAKTVRTGIFDIEENIGILRKRMAMATKRLIENDKELTKEQNDALKERLSQYLEYKTTLEEFDSDYFKAYKEYTRLQLLENYKFKEDSIGLYIAITKAYKEELDKRNILENKLRGGGDSKRDSLGLIDILPEDVPEEEDRFKPIISAFENFSLIMRDISGDLADSISGSLGGAFDDILLEGKSVTASLASAWTSFRDSFISMINQMIAKALAFALVQSILGFATNGAVGGGGFGANFLKSLTGGGVFSGAGDKAGDLGGGGFKAVLPKVKIGNQGNNSVNAILQSNAEVVRAINGMNSNVAKTLYATQTVIGDRQIMQANTRGVLKSKSTVPRSSV